MNAKMIILVVVISVLAIVGVVRTASKGRYPESQRTVELKGKEKRNTLALKERVELAKMRGEQQIIIPGSISANVEVENLDEAFSTYTVVIAQPIEVKSFLDMHDTINSWYKFKVIETLSKKAPPADTSFGNPPDDMLPLKDNEILVPRLNGTVVIDNVKVTAPDKDFPMLDKTQRYLLFLSVDTTGNIGRLELGSAAVASITPDGKIETTDKQQDRLKLEMKGRYNGSLNQLKEEIKGRSNQQ